MPTGIHRSIKGNGTRSGYARTGSGSRRTWEIFSRRPRTFAKTTKRLSAKNRTKPDTAYETTGTTSKKTKRVYFSRQEIKEAGWAGAVGLWGVGVRPADRVASAFDYSFWVSGPVLVASCEALGCFHVEAGRLDPKEFYERLSDYKLAVIVGDPSWLLRLSEIAEERGPWPGVKLLIGGGENATEETRCYIEKVWKADYLLSYGQTEAFGAIGMESLAKDGFHLNEFHNRFEIINRDEKGRGELVYTTLNRRVMPLVRYRSGDLTRFIETPSADGHPGRGPAGAWLAGRRIEKLKGRVDEWTVTAMGNIAPWMFEPIFSGIEGAGDWQIAVDKDGKKDAITFRLEAAREDGELRERILAKLKKEFTEAFRVYEMGLLTIAVEIVPKGALRDGQRKLRRILDLRQF
ncbi:MAG: phenylacetate--CoA ligase family protein [Candidatus Omnitrophica bacterium]|nr:phenylacetate--CoA ligase family protein [Candidatus Omnitrophota bacterium]